MSSLERLGEAGWLPDVRSEESLLYQACNQPSDHGRARGCWVTPPGRADTLDPASQLGLAGRAYAGVGEAGKRKAPSERRVPRAPWPWRPCGAVRRVRAAGLGLSGLPQEPPPSR